MDKRASEREAKGFRYLNSVLDEPEYQFLLEMPESIEEWGVMNFTAPNGGDWRFTLRNISDVLNFLRLDLDAPKKPEEISNWVRSTLSDAHSIFEILLNLNRGNFRLMANNSKAEAVFEILYPNNNPGHTQSSRSLVLSDDILQYIAEKVNEGVDLTIPQPEIYEASKRDTLADLVGSAPGTPGRT